jgi:hypothetical protein
MPERRSQRAISMIRPRHTQYHDVAERMSTASIGRCRLTAQSIAARRLSTSASSCPRASVTSGPSSCSPSWRAVSTAHVRCRSSTSSASPLSISRSRAYQRTGSSICSREPWPGRSASSEHASSLTIDCSGSGTAALHISMPASSVNDPGNTLSRRKHTCSCSVRSWWLHATDASSVRCLAIVSRAPPTSSPKRSPRRPASSTGDMVAVRAAASSIANGIPSRRRHTSARAVPSALSGSKPGRTSRIRSTSRRPASLSSRSAPSAA